MSLKPNSFISKVDLNEIYTKEMIDTEGVSLSKEIEPRNILYDTTHKSFPQHQVFVCINENASREFNSNSIKSEPQEYCVAMDESKLSLLDQDLSSNRDRKKDAEFVSGEMILCEEDNREFSMKDEVSGEFFVEEPSSLADVKLEEDSSRNENSRQEKEECLSFSTKEKANYIGVSSQSNADEKSWEADMCLGTENDGNPIENSSSSSDQATHTNSPQLHLRTEPGEKPFKCTLCRYQTARKESLKRHLYTHSGEKPFKCSSCSYQAIQKGHIERHLRTHTGEKSFKCSLCPFQGASKDSIERHLLSHTGEKPFKCNLCPYRAAMKENLRRHFFIHIEKKPFKCSSCSYQSAQKEHLVKHLRTHTGEKPFICSLCPYQASQKGQIVVHLRTHTGEKPFKCSLCPYRAAKKENLKRHSLIHTGEKPFKCGSCSYQASQKGNIDRHLHRKPDHQTAEYPTDCPTGDDL